AFAPDGRTLAAASGNEVKVWDPVAARELVSHQVSGGVNRLAFAPDGHTLAAGCGSQKRQSEVRLCDARTWEEKAPLLGHTDAVAAVAFAPDSNSLASASKDQTVKIWKVPQEPHWTAPRGHANPAVSVAVSPNGRTVASGSYDRTVKLWDAATGEEQATLPH